MPFLYTIRPESPTAHRATVVLSVSGVATPAFDLVLPSWVPGSYHILDYARNIDRLAAADAATHAPLPVTRVDKARWRIDRAGAAAVEVTYSVYGHDLVTEGFDVTPDHLFVNAALGLPYVDGHTTEPYDVALIVPPDWKVYTELAQVGLHPPTYRARSYDELVDSPIDCGRPFELGFHAAGVAHRVLLCGEGGNFEAHRLEEDLRKISEATARIFGELPAPHYTYFYHLNDIPDGGLEHATSSSNVIFRQAFRPASSYQRFLWLSSHEYFHSVNVKRIRPAAFVPFDYTKETYTRLLWAMEGTTDYYGLLLLPRAGLISAGKFLEKLAGEAQRYLAIPGRRVRSLEEASFVTWIDLYRPMEESRNRSVSYYLKGLLVSCALDLEIRHRTENRASLDTAWRALWTRFGKPDRGVGEEELLPTVSEAVGLDLAPFFARFVSGTDELDLGGYLRFAGLEFGPKPKPSAPEDDGEPGWLGVEHETRDGRVRIVSVYDGGPGRRAGLSPTDEIVAIDGNKITPDEFPKALLRAPAGTEVELTVFRRGRLTVVPLTTGAPPPEKYQIVPTATPTPMERTIYESWLESKWEPPKRPDAS